MTPEGTVCQSRVNQWNGIRATNGVIGKGKYYFEAKVSDEGLCRVGWATNEVRLIAFCVYNYQNLISFNKICIYHTCLFQGSLDLGTDLYGFGFGGTGKKSNNKQFDTYGESYGLNDVIGCALDLDIGALSFYKNGVNLGKAFDIPPGFKNKALFPAVALKVCI